MARITMEEQPDFLVFPTDTLLLLKVLESNTQEVPGRDGRDGWTKCSFKFKIMQVLAVGDGSPVDAWAEMVGKEIYGSVPWRLTDSAENKLRIWSEALLQVELGLGFDLDTNMFPGRMVKGITSQYDGKAVNPATNQKFKRHQVETLLSAGGGGGLGSPVQSEAPGQGWGGPPPQQQGGWGQQQPTQQYGQPVQSNGGGWATPGVQQQPQAPAAPAAQQQQWAPQQNLQQQGQEQQYAQQSPPQPQAQPPAQPAQQGFAQQQIQQYTQPPAQQAPEPDPWASPVDPNEPTF